MNEATKKILLNEEAIAINQDALGKQAERKISNASWSVFVKPLSNGDYAIAFLNRTDTEQQFKLDFAALGLQDKYEVRDLWLHKNMGRAKSWKGLVASHETILLRLSPAKK